MILVFLCSTLYTRIRLIIIYLDCDTDIESEDGSYDGPSYENLDFDGNLREIPKSIPAQNLE